MSWLPDPFDAAQPPTVYQAPDEEEELTPEEERAGIFFSHQGFRPPGADYKARPNMRENAMELANEVTAFAATDLCRFQDGQHYPGRKCPHYDAVDEMGMRVNPRWTAQM